MKPIIGITECYKFENYEYAIEKHGGKVKQLIIGDDYSDTKIDGLLLPGGGDIAPELYGEKLHPKTKYINRDRDDFEISLFSKAIEQNIPVFGICRGIQIMNVAMGGSLYQDIRDLYPKPSRNHQKLSNDQWHDVSIEPDTKLMEIVGTNTDEVNSAHHQGIKEIGDGLVATARSDDGIIEAFEYQLHLWAIAVQYHPERMKYNHGHQDTDGEFLEHASKLFKAFIKAALE